MANKETELTSTKQAASQETDKAKEKLTTVEGEIKKPQAELGQEKGQHYQTISSKKKLEDKYQEGLATARVEAIEQYKASNEHMNKFMVAHKAGMERYQKSVKGVELRKALKRQTGQSLASTVE